jgi:ATP-dependent helicase/nuclease subunit B
MALTQSRLDSYVQCPFKHFCTYTLKLTEERRARLDNLNIGTFLHAILERFLSDIKKEGIDHATISAEERRERVKKIAETESERLLRGAGTRQVREALQIGRLTKAAEIMAESLCREFSHENGFKPAFFELRIGGADGPRPPKLKTPDGEPIFIYGTIDRVDALRAGDDVYLRVVDYKTGAKTFSLDDVYRGIGVQLLIYLFSLWRSGVPGVDGELAPAGATYFSARPSVQSAGGMIDAETARELAIDGISRSGILLSDENVIAAMDKELSGKYAGAKVGSNGALKSLAGTTLVSAEGFGTLQGELEKVISEIASKMKSGVADAAPMKVAGRSPCDWCDMKYVCRRMES